MDLLVTGTSGFTGSRIALYLAGLPQTDVVVGVDSRPPQVFHPKLEQHTVDLTDWQAYAPLLERRYHAVIHAAADQTTPYLSLVNMVAMKTLLELCERTGVQRFVFFSSFYASMSCNNNYRYAKLDSEHELRRSGLRHVILRPDTIYAHGEPKLTTLLRSLRRHVVPVVGRGNYLRTPTYAWDLCRVLERMLADDNFPGQIYDVGSPTPYSMNQMLRLMAQEMGVSHYLPLSLPPQLLRLIFSVTQTADADQMGTVTADRVADPTPFIDTFGVQLTDFADGVRYLCHGDERWPL